MQFRHNLAKIHTHHLSNRLLRQKFIMKPHQDGVSLIAQLESARPQARVNALVHLIRIGLPAVPELMEALRHHPDMNVRWYAAYALGLIGDTSAVSALAGALDDNLYVSHNAHRALEMIGTPEARAALDNWRRRTASRHGVE
jgi:HEAT repeat protein